MTKSENRQYRVWEFTESNEIFRKLNVLTPSAEEGGEALTIFGPEEQIFLIFCQPSARNKDNDIYFRKSCETFVGFTLLYGGWSPQASISEIAIFCLCCCHFIVHQLSGESIYCAISNVLCQQNVCVPIKLTSTVKKVTQLKKHLSKICLLQMIVLRMLILVLHYIYHEGVWNFFKFVITFCFMECSFSNIWQRLKKSKSTGWGRDIWHIDEKRGSYVSRVVIGGPEGRRSLVCNWDAIVYGRILIK